MVLAVFALASSVSAYNYHSGYHSYNSYSHYRPYYTSDVISVKYPSYSHQTAYYGRNKFFYTTPIQRNYDVKTYRLYYPEHRHQRYNLYW